MQFSISYNQTINATAPARPARTPQPTLDLLAAPVKIPGAKADELGAAGVNDAAAGTKLVAAIADVVADAPATGLEMLPLPEPEPLPPKPEPEPLPPEPDPEPLLEIGVGAALGIGTNPTTLGGGPAFPPAATDAVGCTVTKVT